MALKQQPANVCVSCCPPSLHSLDILPHIKDTSFPCVKRRHSGHHHCWHATRPHYYINAYLAVATVGSHGHLPDGLRLYHQDGVGRGLCAITGCRQDEDLAAGQRNCTRIVPFYTAKPLTRPLRCPSFPQPPPSPPCSTTMSTSPTVLTTKKEKRCGTCAA